MDDILQEFVAETRETLDAISGEIVAWEADPADRARLDAIFRFVHTVKGSCGFLDLPRLARLSHAAEDMLAAVRAGDRPPDRALVNAVLAIVDRIGEIVEAIDAGVALDDSDEELLLAALTIPPSRSIAAGAAAAAPNAPARAPVRSIRLSVDLLDRMMNGVSEMVLARNELARRLRETGDETVATALDRLSLTIADLRDTVSRTRMQPVETLFSALPRVVRDTAATLGKQVALTIEGGEVELDREMIEMLRDPLVHIVRNALDHGIEPPAERRAAGKRETGRLAVSARQSGNRIIVEIADDGRGIDTDRLVAKLIALAPEREAELRASGEKARLDLIFEPGLSIRDSATATSGRGVGMDVVRNNVAQVRGRVTLANQPGQGLTIAIEVPLTLAILPAIVIETGGQRFALPRQAVNEIVALPARVVRVDRIGGALVATVRERQLPMVSLETVLGLPARDPAMLVILDVAGGAFALAIDDVVDSEELVIRPAAPAVMAAGIYAGQTLPDSGVPMLLLDVAGIAEAAGIYFPRADADEAPVAAPPADPPRLALLFDDIDGRRRAIALGAIDRIDAVSPGSVCEAGGRWWLRNGEEPVALVSAAALGAPRRAWSALRLHDESGAVACPILDAIDIVALPAEIVPPATPGVIAGVVMIAGEPVELLDPPVLLEQAVGTGRIGRTGRTGHSLPGGIQRPLCLLHGAEAGWMDVFLRPAIEAAGYRVVRRLDTGAAADVVLAMEDEDRAGIAAGRIVRLGRSPGDPLYRYDRAALIAALAGDAAAARA